MHVYYYYFNEETISIVLQWHNEVTPEQKALLKTLNAQQTSTIKPEGTNTG